MCFYVERIKTSLFRHFLRGKIEALYSSHKKFLIFARADVFFSRVNAKLQAFLSTYRYIEENVRRPRPLFLFSPSYFLRGGKYDRDDLVANALSYVWCTAWYIPPRSRLGWFSRCDSYIARPALTMKYRSCRCAASHYRIAPPTPEIPILLHTRVCIGGKKSAK